MKKYILTIALAVLSSVMFAQEKTAPRTEFTVALSAAAVTLQAGESKDITIFLNRSKSFARSKAVVGTSSALPQGVTITFDPAECVAESSVAHLAVAADAKPGQYMIILNGTMQNKSKGTMLKLSIGTPAETVSSN